jgi:hypothetical protein
VALDLALQTNRTLIVQDTSTMHDYLATKHACPNTKQSWDCLFKPLTSCTLEKVQQCDDELKITADFLSENPSFPPALAWIKKRASRDDLAYAYFFGRKRVIRVKKKFSSGGRRVSSVAYRAAEKFARQLSVKYAGYSTFSLRSNIQYFLWRFHPQIQQGLDAAIKYEKLSPISNSTERFIGCHIRLTDNINTVETRFKLNPKIANSFERCLHVVDSIRAKDKSIRKIFIASDSSIVIRKIQQRHRVYKGCKIYWQSSVPRAGHFAKWDWYPRKSSGVITDIELLSRATYLVGSMTSNVFRLAAELRQARAERENDGAQQRIFSVDFPWTQYP